jgi:small subunit ribosomal protein S6
MKHGLWFEMTPGRTVWSDVPCSRLLRAFEPFPKGTRGLAPDRRNLRKGIRMPLYEHVYLARQDLSQQQVDELTAHYKGVIEQMGGNVAKVEYWGVKSLTYRIRKNRKAHFTLLNLDAPPAAIGEVRVEELESGPSAMMRKVDRDRDRDERRGERRRDRDGPRGPRGDSDDVEMTEH